MTVDCSKNWEEECRKWSKKYKELKTIYNATISKHIADKLEWLKDIGKLHDRIRSLERERMRH